MFWGANGFKVVLFSGRASISIPERSGDVSVELQRVDLSRCPAGSGVSNENWSVFCFGRPLRQNSDEKMGNAAPRPFRFLRRLTKMKPIELRKSMRKSVITVATMRR